MHATNPAAADRAPTRWRAPLRIKASAACHLGAAALVAAAPPLWPWALGAVALDHALLTATGLWPRSTWLGANLLRLPDAAAARGEVAVTLDDGPDPAVTPQVLDILDAHGARATFFCIAEQAVRHPALAREIVRRGHSVQNHSLGHRHNFSLLGPAGLRREIGQAQDRLAQATGQRPTCFRAPAGLRNVFLDPVLHALDLRLVSWTRRGFDTREADPQTVLARLTHLLAAGDIVLLHDRHGACMADGRPVVLQALPLLLTRLRGAGLQAVTLPEALHP
ncbi:polysaccharide deacetylase family protein [Pseudorhodoferax sp. Leaf274]|uniref:polysaccharide deacetylase family protein n=1 Tax=Pseudorhodoferax sp. Leaf274 TaxID=1736318 RepID=UPI0007038074|nr:polysaccharide deacetylase family protein [Pseudorhodoferax sp. Leaf274]KQP39057.1 polysaccharide deacetylase [Pseudorhodoferax sp. Leaf274]